MSLMHTLLNRLQPIGRIFTPSCLLRGNPVRGFATVVNANKDVQISKIRNIGISAHIDSGKTTLTERILYYTGRINDIHEVRGKDGVGAKMDFMELEREKGITIQSAATHCIWGGNTVNIIDTPGHVDFTIEVERALRVLDGAILVVCGVGGVQSQTHTVDRQMKRYNVPRLVFINKLDRMSAEPWVAIEQLRQKIGINAVAVQVPIGLEDRHHGVIDLVKKEAIVFDGYKGSSPTIKEIPADYVDFVEEKREELIENLGDLDEELATWMVENEYPDKQPPVELLKAAIRRQVIQRNLVPVFMGSAYKNVGVQPLLDGVVDYLPDPTQKENTALEIINGEETPIVLEADRKKPFVALAFKLEEGGFGQLTYLRIYQGMIRRGDTVRNVTLDKSVKVMRLVKMHANEMEEIQEAGAGEIAALFGIDCYSGNTFTIGTRKFSMSSMHVPEPVISLSISPASKKDQGPNFSKALQRFQKEDPTFRVVMDQAHNQTIIRGMGELHLFIYLERMRREYGIDCIAGKPLVAYKETIRGATDFDHLHKKQSGGAGQFARIMGSIEAIPDTSDPPLQFVNKCTGTTLPPGYIEAVRKGFLEFCEKGPTVGHPLVGVKFTLKDGVTHSVDSSDLAFKICTINCMRDYIYRTAPTLLEPVMKVEVQIPSEFQDNVLNQLNRRKAVIKDSVNTLETATFTCEVSLNNMFGYSNELRSSTQGKGEFSMEYANYAQVAAEDLEELVKEHYKRKAEMGL